MRRLSANAGFQLTGLRRFARPAAGALIGGLALFAVIGDWPKAGGTVEGVLPSALPTAEGPRDVLHKELSGDETISTKLTAPEFWDALNAVTPGERGAPARDALDKQKPVRPMPAFDSLGDRRIMRGDSSAPMYRTVCVRTCDGFFWPISFAATEEGFARDQKACEASCGSDVKLFRYRSNSGAVVGDPFAAMQDMAGQPYKALKTAYLFRTTYNDACKCKPHPWEEAAQTRHKSYATETTGEAAPTATASHPIGAPVSAVRATKPVSVAEPRSIATGSVGAVRSKAGPRQTAPERSNLSGVTPRPPEAARERVVMLHLGGRSPIAVRVEPPPARRVLRN